MTQLWPMPSTGVLKMVHTSYRYPSAEHREFSRLISGMDVRLLKQQRKPLNLESLLLPQQAMMVGAMMMVMSQRHAVKQP